MIFISPPFGNYLNLTKTTSIKGSFTLNERPHKWYYIFKTLRYSFKHKGWVNKIGLRNPGIDWAIRKYKDTNDIISIAIMEENEVDLFLHKIPKKMNLELNVSCPNVGKHLIDDKLYKFLNDERKWCIVKLSPLTKMEKIDKYYKDGFRQFHCSNTLPTNQLNCKYEGGLSGKKLVPYTTKLIKEIKEKYPDTEIIAGGGIDSIEMIQYYHQKGADHYSVSSVLFSPIKFMLFYMNLNNQ